jgi:hypothetical protein
MEAAHQLGLNEAAVFHADVSGGEFLAGSDRGYWRMKSVNWPVTIITVAAAARPLSPEHYAFSFDLTGYPGAPAAQLWDVTTDSPLVPANWPAGTGRVALAFNPGWRQDAIYLPVDRIALQGHDPWLQQHPGYVWDTARDICQYLELLHDLLNCEAYSGVHG